MVGQFWLINNHRKRMCFLQNMCLILEASYKTKLHQHSYWTQDFVWPMKRGFNVEDYVEIGDKVSHATQEGWGSDASFKG